MTELKRALEVYKVKGTVTVERYDFASLLVKVNGKNYGVWDTVKNNFVA